ncbi:MAG TPA: class I SAM-dependent methyltransferase [Clostridia bacterium]
MYVNQESYEEEAAQIKMIVDLYKKTSGMELLDIACGTGGHAMYLKENYNVIGIDLSRAMLNVAKGKMPDVRFIEADMFDFNLGTKYDIILNLYGSICFAESYNQLIDGMKCASMHLKEGGVYILIPWSTADTFNPGIVSKSKNFGDVSYSRMESIQLKPIGKIEVEMHHLIGKDNQIKHFHHTLNLSLFREEEYLFAIKESGLKLIQRLNETDFRMGAFICTK